MTPPTRSAVTPGASIVIRGARVVAERAMMFANFAELARPALVNGAAGIVGFSTHGRPFSVTGFTVVGGKILEIDILSDPVRIDQLDLTVLND